MNATFLSTTRFLRSVIISAGLALGFAASACAEEESHDNVAGCEAFVDDLTDASIECGVDPGDFVVSIDCSVYANVTTCDIEDYWACVGNAYSCDADLMVVDVDLTVMAECASLARCD